MKKWVLKNSWAKLFFPPELPEFVPVRLCSAAWPYKMKYAGSSQSSSLWDILILCFAVSLDQNAWGPQVQNQFYELGCQLQPCMREAEFVSACCLLTRLKSNSNFSLVRGVILDLYWCKWRAECSSTFVALPRSLTYPSNMTQFPLGNSRERNLLFILQGS